jgi:hypothetical protein
MKIKQQQSSDSQSISRCRKEFFKKKTVISDVPAQNTVSVEV